MITQVFCLIVGIITLIISFFITTPELILFFRTKNTSGTSLTTYVLFFMSGLIWVIWSYAYYFLSIMQPGVKITVLYQASLVPAIISNLFNLLLSIVILYFKIRHIFLAKKLNMNQLQLSVYLQKKQIDDNNRKVTWWIKYRWLVFILAIVAILIIISTVILVIYGLPKSLTQDVYNKFKIAVLCINLIAAISWEAISWPQLIKCIKTKDVTGISLGWAIFLPCSCIISFLYDLLLSCVSGEFNFAIIGSLVFNGIIVNISILIIKIKYLLKSHKLGLSEIEYYEKVLKPIVDAKKKN